MARILCRGGRTGTKIHAGDTGSSVLSCGHWLKANASYFRVRQSQVHGKNLCEKCFGEVWRNQDVLQVAEVEAVFNAPVQKSEVAD